MLSQGACSTMRPEILLMMHRHEIGQRSLVSRILSGERNLSVDHISVLAERFNVSAEVFIEPHSR